MRDVPRLFVVLPCYNEEEIIEYSVGVMLDQIKCLVSDGIIKENSRIVYVNDGSADRTAELLTEYCHNNSLIELINFSRNFGHQSAILAGMLSSIGRADAVITIDADLQQDVTRIRDFVQAYMDGADVVYGVRNDRDIDGLFKKLTASAYYKLMQMMGCEVRANSADYRLLSNKAVRILSEYKESSLFLRGIIPLMGLQSDVVYFDVKERTAGKSKYTLRKMMTLAVDGVTSLSIKPIRFITILGMFMFLFSLLMIIISLVDYAMGNVIKGYSTTVISIWLVGGCLMVSMGVVGEYIGKIYCEVKERPRYIIDSVIRKGDDEFEE